MDFIRPAKSIFMAYAVLLMKFEAVGLGNVVIRWFDSYLCDRQHLVDSSGSHSKPAPGTCGVP